MGYAAFLEREFALDGGVLLVRFYTPSKAPGGEFQCRYSVGWLEREVRRNACGLDGVQALMLAMRTVHTELVESDGSRSLLSSRRIAKFASMTNSSSDSLDRPCSMLRASRMSRIPSFLTASYRYAERIIFLQGCSAAAIPMNCWMLKARLEAPSSGDRRVLLISSCSARVTAWQTAATISALSRK